MRHDQIALQLYTIRDEMKRDRDATLRRVGAMGYPAVELVLGNDDDHELRAVLDECGLQACGAHVALETLEADPHKVAARLKTLGARYAVVPWVGPGQRGSMAAVQALADTLNRLGAVMQEAGLSLAYHNHDFEFATVEGETFWERLLQLTDPALVGFELDLYWASVAGHDPQVLLERYAGRIPLVHLKDRAPGDPPRDAPFGSGVLPWAELLPAAEASGAKWFVVEQDNPSEPLTDSEQSLRALEQATGTAQ